MYGGSLKSSSYLDEPNSGFCPELAGAAANDPFGGRREFP